MARVGIIVPTYKRPDMLRECLLSIQRQTFTDLEVLVCDNSPQGEARQVVEQLEDQRFTYIGRPRNLGMLENVLDGFRASESSLVMEVDDDDLLYSNCLAELVAPFDQQPDLALSFADLDVVDGSQERLPLWRRREFIPDRPGLTEGRIQPFTAIAARGWVFMVATLLRRDAVDWYAIPPESGTAYDRYLGLVASRDNAAAFYVPRPVMAYRVHASSDGLARAAPQLAGALYVLEAEQAGRPGDRTDYLQNEITRTRLLLCRAQIHEGDIRSAWHSLAPVLAPSQVAGTFRAVVGVYGPRRVRKLSRRLLRRLHRRARGRSDAHARERWLGRPGPA